MQRRDTHRSEPYRILSLDGGGIRGLITTILLERLTAAVPGWLDQVDLIAGTSTGGIIALGLAHGLTPTAIRQLYYDKGPLIFKDSLWDNIKDLGNLLGAQYDNKQLRLALTEIAGDTKLADLQKKVLIATFDLDSQLSDPARRSWKAKFFHNFAGDDSDGDARLIDVALYTSAAPTYFPMADGFIDGGVVANNPALAAIAQTQDNRAKIEERPQLEEIVLLSVSTGLAPHFITGENEDWGSLRWLGPLIQIFTEGVAGVTDYQCRQLLQARYERLLPLFPAGDAFALDDWQRRDEMVSFAQEVPLDDTVGWLQQRWTPANVIPDVDL